MNSVVSLSRFKTEIEQCHDCSLTYEDPLTPVDFHIAFDHIAVSTSASPYIALRSNDAEVCLSHIENIKECCRSGDTVGFIVQCNDYSASDDPVQVKFTLRCHNLHK